MYIEEIKWLDKEEKEAILKVANDTQSLASLHGPALCTPMKSEGESGAKM